MGEDVTKFVRQSIIKDIDGYLYGLFGTERARAIFFALGFKIEELLKVADFHGDKQVEEISRKKVIPIIALYRCLKENGMMESEATKLINDYLFRAIRPEINKLASFNSFPLYFSRFRKKVKKYEETEFLDGPFKVQWLENSDSRIAFNVCKCAYCEILDEYNSTELKEIFCLIEKKLFSNASNNIIMTLDKTIATGSDRCEFRFIHK